jgi:hypothetical protein
MKLADWVQHLPGQNGVMLAHAEAHDKGEPTGATVDEWLTQVRRLWTPKEIAAAKAKAEKALPLLP